jgi:hypothetical protein
MVGAFPSSSGILRRRGYTNHISTTITSCESLMVYTANSGTETMFAAIGTDFYNVTSAGALGAAVVSGLANARWQAVNFTNSAGTSYLCTFNGADSPRYWDGATWTAVTGVSTPAITGLTTSTIISAAIHQRRMWLVQVNSLKAWYLPIDSVGGAAKALDLGGVASMGGYIMAIESWTVDGGDGLDDYLIVVTSKGQVIAYQGTDPSSASTWVHVGTWNIAPPIGRRSLCSYKGDLLILTNSGIASVTKIMAGDTTVSGMLSDKISGSYAEAVASASSVPDLWQLLYYPKADMLLFSPSTQWAYAMNTVTGAWGGPFLGAYTWALFGGEPYFGGVTSNNNIRKFWDTTTDNGGFITFSVVHGFSELELPGIIKQVTQMRVVLNSDASFTLSAGIQLDFKAGVFSTSNILSAQQGISPWQGVSGRGVAVSPGVGLLNGLGSFIYNGCYLLYQTGGLVGAAQLT